MIRSVSAVAIGAATALFATSALAQETVTATVTTPSATPSQNAAQTAPDTSPDNSGVSAALLLGYGFGSVGGGGESVNPYGLGFGARVGYSFPMHLYVGGTFVYHLGGSLSDGNESVTYSTWYLAGEVGYEIPAGPVVVRPYLGLGLGEAHVGSITVNGVTVGGGSSSGAVFYPGATVLYPLTQQFAIGGDARFTIFSADGTSDNAFALFLTAQYHF